MLSVAGPNALNSPLPTALERSHQPWHQPCDQPDPAKILTQDRLAVDVKMTGAS